MSTSRTRVIDSSKAISPSLDGLPVSVSTDYIYPHLSVNELGMFARSFRVAERETAFLRLLVGAVDAEPESYKQKNETKLAAIAILKRHPELLFRKGLVTDHYGRKIWASPYQLFCGTSDVWALRKVHKDILLRIEDGGTKAQSHFKAQFPNCPWPLDSTMGEEVLYDDRNKEQVAQVIAQLRIIVQKITVDPCTNGVATRDETTKAVADLCQIFAPKEGEIIRTGLHFPQAIMREIGMVYDAKFRLWSVDKLAFFSREVIGAAEAALTSVDGQRYKQGLCNLNMQNGPDRRDGLFCCRPKGIPENLAPISDKLGRTMFVDPYIGYSCFMSSTAGVYIWYDKNGALPLPPNGILTFFGTHPYPRGFAAPGVPCGKLMENESRDIWQHYAATQRPVNTSSPDQPMRCVIL